MNDASPATDAATLAALRIPTDEEGPVFSEPWQAQVFALAINLHRRGCFSWSEWTECLGHELAESTAEGDVRSYYECWLAALEHLVDAKSLIPFTELMQRGEQIAANPPGHDHVARRKPVRVA